MKYNRYTRKIERKLNIQSLFIIQQNSFKNIDTYNKHSTEKKINLA
jgi:hypothetical protein